jgi:hypothetical protein
VHKALMSGKINQDNYDKVMSKLTGSKKWVMLQMY